jgi:hypothetical protein
MPADASADLRGLLNGHREADFRLRAPSASLKLSQIRARIQATLLPRLKYFKNAALIEGVDTELSSGRGILYSTGQIFLSLQTLAQLTFPHTGDPFT